MPSTIHPLTAHTGDMFRLIHYAAIPHLLRLPLGAFLDEIASKGAVHAALGSSRRRAFHADLRLLAERHFGAAVAGAGAATPSGQLEGAVHLGEQLAAAQHPQLHGIERQQSPKVRAILGGREA